MRNPIFRFWISLLLCLSLNGYLAAQPVKIQTQLPRTTNTVLQRQSIADGVYYLKVLNTGKYLGVAGIDPRNGAALIQWDFVNAANLVAGATGMICAFPSSQVLCYKRSAGKKEKLIYFILNQTAPWAIAKRPQMAQ